MIELLNQQKAMGQMNEAFLLAALEYIDRTHFGYCLSFHEDEAVDIAFAHLQGKHPNGTFVPGDTE